MAEVVIRPTPPNTVKTPSRVSSFPSPHTLPLSPPSSFSPERICVVGVYDGGTVTITSFVWSFRSVAMASDTRQLCCIMRKSARYSVQSLVHCRRSVYYKHFHSTCSRFDGEVDPFPAGHPDNKTVVLYGRPTTRVEKVMYILEELNVPYIRIHFESPPPLYFTNVNPMRLVPAIRDGLATINGSNAICVYLAHKFGQENEIFPSSSVYLGQAFQWADFMEGYLATPRLNHVFHALVNKAYPPSLAKLGCPTDEEIETSINLTAAALRILDDHLARNESNRPFIASTNNFTFADAVAAPWIHKWHSHALNFGPKLARSEFPAVCTYYELLTTRPAFHRGILYRANESL